MTWSWDGTPLLGRAPALLPSPYGLTWLQRECGKILVKMWYVAAALAGTLLEPPDVLFFASGGYDTLLRDGFATVRPHHFWKWALSWKNNNLRCVCENYVPSICPFFFLLSHRTRVAESLKPIPAYIKRHQTPSSCFQSITELNHTVVVQTEQDTKH